MKIQTKELTGAALDWAVAWCQQVDVSEGLTDDERYSTNWAQGGPLKEREGIVSGPSVKGDFFAFKPVKGADSIRAFGPTELVAAMRCLVAVKLGDVVEVPDELA